MSYTLALRRHSVRRALSRAAANFVAVVAVTAIFGLKAYIDSRGATLAETATPADAVIAASRAESAGR